ncbi:nickel transporter permease [Desulfitobacterium chlororespirans]|uniref:nickel transporter permease n=1 Tax=Desulfitobacterium chlororespirans TaxID=51616 RepID=UPI0009341B90|nr:nickel transporter permease [Desulfitobacterium chlororespirans]
MNKTKKRLAFSLLFVMVLAGIAIFAPYIATHDPRHAILSAAVKPPSSEHWFGTDPMGRDLFSRIVYGARTSLSSTLILVLSIFTLGGVMGIVAGYFGGIVDAVIMRISDMMVSFPGMALAIAMAGIMGPSITNAVIAITIVSWTKYARIARSLVLKIKHQEYILAAQMAGGRARHILWRYMLPSVLPTLVITAATDMGGMMLELAGFSFLGLGAQSTSIEWGYMLNEGRAYMESTPWLIIFPGISIFVAVVAFNLLGDNLRDLLDPRDENTTFYKRKRRRINVKKFLKVTAIVAMVSLMLGTLSGCGGTAASAGDTTKTAHLNFGCYNYSDSIDPATNTNSSWCFVRYGIGENLFKFSDQVVAEPNLCDNYTVSDDFTQWQLHIREGVKFSNGNAVTATAVKASLERLYAETDAAQGGKGNSNPDGYLVYESITADDATGVVTLTCSEPTENIPGILAYPYFAIVDVTQADQEIIGTGPYKVKSTNTGVSMEVERNEYYWNGPVPYDSITIIFIDDSSTKAMALKSGDVDLVENVTTASDLNALQNDSAYYVSTAAGVRTANAYMNHKGALSNKALRQAIMMALDKETMCSITTSGMYTAGISVLPSSLDYNYDQLTNPYPFNKQAAIDVLDEAGIVDRDGDGWRELNGKTIDLDHVAFTSRNLDQLAQAVALQLNEIGIKVTVNIRDYDTALALSNAGEFDLFTCNTLTVGVGDPQDYLGNWYSKNSGNYGYYSNPQYDQLYEQLTTELDRENRVNLITQLQQILIDDAATIAYGYYNSRMISNAAKVTGADIATIDYYWLTTDIKPVE